MQISGTASIDNHGKTIYIKDPYQQIKRTLLNIKNLLNNVGLDFSDIVCSTCFFKDPSSYKLLKKIIEELNITDFPSINVIANVCRDNLLFEIDAIAVKIDRNDANSFRGE